MRALRRLAQLLTRIRPFGPPAVIDGSRLEINRRVHKLIYGTEQQ